MFLKVDIISHVILWYTGNKLFFWKHLVHLISKRIFQRDQFKQNRTQPGSTAHVLLLIGILFLGILDTYVTEAVQVAQTYI